MGDSTTTRPVLDTHPEQAKRVADYLEAHPASSAKKIDAACDTGCITKVLSAMRKELGYRLSHSTDLALCANGAKSRYVRLYTLLARPSECRDLFTPE